MEQVSLLSQMDQVNQEGQFTPRTQVSYSFTQLFRLQSAQVAPKNARNSLDNHIGLKSVPRYKKFILLGTSQILFS